MALKENSEILFMNYLKFFGIVYLLIWHTAVKGLNVIVISFFLQLFFFVSGYFYKDAYSEQPLLFIRRRIQSLYFPFVLYCSAFLALNNLFVHLNIYTAPLYIPHGRMVSSLLDILTLEPGLQLAGAMWFVSSLFLSSLIFCSVSAALEKTLSFARPVRTYHESVRVFLLFSLFLLGNYLSHANITLPRYLDVSLVLLFFYYLGYLYRKNEEHIPVNIFLALTALATLLVCSRYGFPLFAQRKYIDPSFVLLCGVSGIYLNVYLAKLFASFGNIRFVNYAGKNTMVILAMHFLAFKLVSLLLIYQQDLPMDMLASFPCITSANQYFRWLYVLAGLVVPLAVKYLLETGWRTIRGHAV